MNDAVAELCRGAFSRMLHALSLQIPANRIALYACVTALQRRHHGTNWCDLHDSEGGHLPVAARTGVGARGGCTCGAASAACVASRDAAAIRHPQDQQCSL